MRDSASDTLFRAVVMGAVLGVVVWAAIRYTTIPQQMLQQIIAWSEQASEKLQQRQAAAGQVGTEQQFVAGQSPGSYPLTDAPNAVALPIGTLQPNPAVAQVPNQQVSYLAQPSTGAPNRNGAVTRREAIERRLRELGSVYCLLETWGNDAPRYRYHCRIAVAGNPQVTRSFEAQGRFPREAMEQVLRAVEASRVQAGFAESRSW